MRPRSYRTSPALRGGAAAALALLMALAVDRAQAQQPDKKEPDKKETAKVPEFQWPTNINGKDINAVMKDMEDPDPVIREFAVRTLPNFGPPAQKENVSKLLLKRMTGAAEKDPGVRVAVFNTVGKIQFENATHNTEALRLLVTYVDAPVGPFASMYRLHAVQTLALFGPKGEGSITALTGAAQADPSYEIRRSVAATLGRVGFIETTGPNMKALTALADRLAKDESAAVRLEAMQSLMLLGPPWAGAGKGKGPPAVNPKGVAEIVRYLRMRIGDPKANPPLPTLEKDKQVEIWARLVLLRFDAREPIDEHVDAFAKSLIGSETAVRIQALNAIIVVGELAGKKLDDVVRVMEEKDGNLNLVVSSIQALMAMGASAKPALPKLKKLQDEKKKDLNAVIVELAKKKDDPQLTGQKATLDELVKLIDAAMAHIEKAKPSSPAGTSTDPKSP